ncbi:PREDICTED: alpha-(1,6)-fucosyltransferase-like [Priapulus caudatus]|uniref:Alpha-(1,6)-fucosyltransferase-like n=1 Tax=Priapulus caudatus TaxID=37621 RepID=A0ABM1DPG2_PRICU|nr:PREDICTED: alpha-(1,6)-fucosyltransferase-like [Priapulus caudatus]
MDGLGEWRKKEADDLAELVQKRLHRLQNPTNCADAKKLVCNVNKGCGYGCQVHHLTYCLMIAYGSQRTLILNSKGWRYSHEGWEKVFLPISDTCTSTMGGSSGHWTDEAGMKNLQIVDLPIIDSIKPRPAYLPLAIPDDLADRLMRLHGNPAVWWTGQLVRFLTRPQSELQRDIDQVREKLGFLSPIVGVHIRRTDKVGTEAALHTVQEYMYHVEDYYQKLELRWPVKVKRVYIATDEPRVLSEARKLYPGYTFLGDESVARTASLGQRYSDASLRGIILDIHFLSQSDYLVCTFSSQVCRLAYEMLNTIHPDASAWFRSLDDIYYFGGQHAHNQRALYKHEKSSVQEIDINVGDVVGIAGNHWDGFSKGLNRNTGQQGLYPSFKVEDIVDIVKMPTYDDDDGGGGGGDGRGE